MKKEGSVLQWLNKIITNQCNLNSYFLTMHFISISIHDDALRLKIQVLNQFI